MSTKTNTVIGVVADTHIPDESNHLPEQLVTDFKHVDVIFHLGDFNDFNTYEELQKIKPVVAVYGNTDEVEIREMLPAKRHVEMHGLKISLIHGWGPPKKIEQRVYEKLNHADFIFYGHSHVPLFTQINGVYLFNPGSPFLNREGAGTYGIIEIGKTIEHKLIRIDH